MRKQPEAAPSPSDWRAMLRARPQRNAAATVEETPEGTMRFGVVLRRPGWLVPPLSWVIRFSDRRQVRLDAIGTQIWQWCDGRRTVEDVIDKFAERYGFTFHEARVAVTGYLRLLVQRGVLAMEQ